MKKVLVLLNFSTSVKLFFGIFGISWSQFLVDIIAQNLHTKCTSLERSLMQFGYIAQLEALPFRFYQNSSGSSASDSTA